MCGDVNLFIRDEENEIEVMVAEPKSRQKGIAKESLFLFMKFCFNELKIDTFTAKILDTNPISIKLFDSLHFKKIKYVQVFQEYIYQLTVNKNYFY